MQRKAAIASESCKVHCKKCHDLDDKVQACAQFMPQASINVFVRAESVLTEVEFQVSLRTNSSLPR